MKLVYKCLHCDAAVTERVPLELIGRNAPTILGMAYNPSPSDMYTPRQYGPHDCKGGGTGVAQLVAVIP
jgi:hypothetical protein